MRTRLKIDPRSISPFRLPNWRWSAAEQAHSLRQRATRLEDPLIVDAVRYLRTWNLSKLAAIHQWPDLSAAHAIYRESGVVKDELEARLLAGQSFPTIAAKTGVAATSIAAFEQYFFNVSHALGAYDWLATQVVRITPGQPVTEGQTWKFLALAAGPALLDLMIDDFFGRQPDPAVPNRGELATKGRYIVRELATDWSCAEQAKACLKEGRRLFRHLFRIGRGPAPDALLPLHIANIEMSVISSAPDIKHTADKSAPTVSQRQRKSRKVSHGRRKTSNVGKQPSSITV